MAKTSDYKESSIVLDGLRRERETMLQRRDVHLSQHADMIRFNYFRGMRRTTLVQKYGQEAVDYAIGAKGEQNV